MRVCFPTHETSQCFGSKKGHCCRTTHSGLFNTGDKKLEFQSFQSTNWPLLEASYQQCYANNANLIHTLAISVPFPFSFVTTYQNRCSHSRGCRRGARAPGRATAGSAWVGTAARAGCRRRACGAARWSGELLAALYPGPAGLHALGLDHEGRTHGHVTRSTWLLPYPTKSLKKQLPLFSGLYFLGKFVRRRLLVSVQPKTGTHRQKEAHR